MASSVECLDRAGSRGRVPPRCFLIALLLIAAWAPLSALQPDLALSQYVHTSWTRVGGFSLPNIQALAQTSDGYLWIGTAGGLFRFNGESFPAWEPPPGESLPSHNIQMLRVSHDGSLWVGSPAAVSRWDGHHLVNYRVGKELPQANLITFTEERSGRLWIGAARSTPPSLTSIQNGIVKVHPMPELPGTSVLSLYEDGKNQVWIGTSNGLCRSPADSAPSCAGGGSAILSIAEDSQGHLLVADRSSRSVVRLSNGRWEPVIRNSGATALAPRVLARDHDGNIWLGTLGQGLFRLRNGRVDRFTRRDGLSGDLIEAVLEDREENLWVGTSNGLDRFRNPKAPRLTTMEGLSGDAITAVCATRDGDLWVGTAGAGLNRVRGDAITAYTLQSGLPNSTVLSLHEDAAKRLWVGTTGGLVLRSHGVFARVRSTQGAPLDRVFAMETGPDGSTWIADEKEGLLIARDGRISPALIPEIRARKNIYQLHSDSTGTLWIGFFDGSLMSIKRGLASLSQSGPINLGPIYALWSETSGTLWVGSSMGLSRLRGDRWTTWTRQDGIPEGGVQGIIEDDAGILWLTTSDGLLSVPLKTLAAASDGAPRPLTAFHYALNEGIRFALSRGLANPRLTKSRDGRLWVATQDGVAMIDPNHLKVNRLPPPVAIERITVDGRNLALGNGNPLSFHANEIQVEYAALSLVEKDSVRFAYRLEGLDSVWRDAGTRRTASFTNLTAGNYRFIVRASNNDGVWNDTGAAFSFYIPPYFYQTYWFAGLCGVSLILASWGLYRWRERNLRATYELMLEERTRVTREVHDTVLQGFAGVLFQLQVVSTQFHTAPDLARQKLERCLVQGDDSLREARETLAFMRLSTLGTSSLREVLTTAGTKLTAGTSIQLSINVTGSPRALRYDLQSNLYLIAREAIWNVVKHAGARIILVNLDYSSPNTLRLSILDDGVGFNPDAIHPNNQHFGLSAMRERARQIGASLNLSSHPDHGTLVDVVVPDKERAHVRAAKAG